MCRAHAFNARWAARRLSNQPNRGKPMTTLTQREPLTPGQELVQGAYESGLEPMRHPRRKSLQEAYGFDDVAIVPGSRHDQPGADRCVDGTRRATA